MIQKYFHFSDEKGKNLESMPGTAAPEREIFCQNDLKISLTD